MKQDKVDTTSNSNGTSNPPIRTPLKIDIKDINNAKYIGKYVEITGTLTEKDNFSFIARTELKMVCRPSDDSKTCTGCHHNPSGTHQIKLDVFNPEILTHINSKEGELKKLYKEIAYVPQDCRRSRFDKFTVNKNLYRSSIVPCIDFVSAQKKSLGETVDSMHSISIFTVLFGDLEVQENRDYRFMGVPHIDPKTQQLMFLVDRVIPIADDISSFEMNDVWKKNLSIFQCDDTFEAITAKNKEILKESRCNHHKIFGYERMEYFIHMTFHSVCAFMFAGKPHYRGWLDGAIIGDPRTGKSEIPEQMIELNQMGYRVSCDNISYAGIAGGMSQSSIKGGAYQLKWGLLPRLDRRIVFFDECKNDVAVKLWPQLNDARSSGLVKVSKIGASERATKARVRKIFSSNPPDDTTTGHYQNPVEMLQGIFKTPESIARLDYFFVPRAQDSTFKPGDEKETVIPNYYANGLNRLLIKWIYSRTAEQVIFTQEAEDYLVQMGQELAKISDDITIPLLQGNEARFTLGRGAAAQAGARASTDESWENIIVHKADCEVWVKTLIANYNHESNNYFAYSRNIIKKIRFENSQEFYEICCKMRVLFGKNVSTLQFLLEEGVCTFRQLQEMSQDIFAIKNIYSGLIRHNLIKVKAQNSSFMKTRRGVPVFRYLMSLDNWDLLDEFQCKAWFDKLSV